MALHTAGGAPLKRVGQLTKPFGAGESALKWWPVSVPLRAMRPTDEPPQSPDPWPQAARLLPPQLEGAGRDTLLADRDVVAYCERRGLRVSEELRTFLRERLGPISSAP